jgi:hypothetical protein
MDVKEIEDRIEYIKAHQRSDPEVAHDLEDTLFIEVLVEIALGHPEPQEIASAALKSQDQEKQKP